MLLNSVPKVFWSSIDKYEWLVWLTFWWIQKDLIKFSLGKTIINQVFIQVLLHLFFLFLLYIILLHSLSLIFFFFISMGSLFILCIWEVVSLLGGYHLLVIWDSPSRGSYINLSRVVVMVFFYSVAVGRVNAVERRLVTILWAGLHFKTINKILKLNN